MQMIFKNVLDDSSGRLIDECGLKGHRIGDAQISERNANFIVNRGNAKAEDVLELIELARSRVQNKFGVSMELEVKIVGE